MEQKQRSRIRKWLLAGILAILLAFGFIFVQRYTVVGIFLLGGGKYWVHRAARTPDPVEAKAYLRRVLSATQYGVNTADNVVREDFRDPRIQRRLYLLLAEIAPNSDWKATYLDLADIYKETPQGDFDMQ